MRKFWIFIVGIIGIHEQTLLDHQTQITNNANGIAGITNKKIKATQPTNQILYKKYIFIVNDTRILNS